MRSKGFSLVEVMMAAGVVAILVIGSFFLFSGNEDGESYIEERSDTVEQAEEVKKSVEDKNKVTQEPLPGGEVVNQGEQVKKPTEKDEVFYIEYEPFKEYGQIRNTVMYKINLESGESESIATLSKWATLEIIVIDESLIYKSTSQTDELGVGIFDLISGSQDLIVINGGASDVFVNDSRNLLALSIEDGYCYERPALDCKGDVVEFTRDGETSLIIEDVNGGRIVAYKKDEFLVMSDSHADAGCSHGEYTVYDLKLNTSEIGYKNTRCVGDEISEEKRQVRDNFFNTYGIKSSSSVNGIRLIGDAVLEPYQINKELVDKKGLARIYFGNDQELSSFSF